MTPDQGRPAGPTEGGSKPAGSQGGCAARIGVAMLAGGQHRLLRADGGEANSPAPFSDTSCWTAVAPALQLDDGRKRPSVRPRRAAPTRKPAATTARNKPKRLTAGMASKILDADAGRTGMDQPTRAHDMLAAKPGRSCPSMRPGWRNPRRPAKQRRRFVYPMDGRRKGLLRRTGGGGPPTEPSPRCCVGKRTQTPTTAADRLMRRSVPTAVRTDLSASVVRPRTPKVRFHRTVHKGLCTAHGWGSAGSESGTSAAMVEIPAHPGLTPASFYHGLGPVPAGGGKTGLKRMLFRPPAGWAAPSVDKTGDSLLTSGKGSGGCTIIDLLGQGAWGLCRCKTFEARNQH